MELEPATLAQVRRARDGRMVLVEDDVLDVVRQLVEIDPSYRVRFSETGGYFVVYGIDGRNKEYLVTTAQELDGRVIARVRKVRDPSYNYAAELDRVDDEAERRREAKINDQVGEIGERLWHAARRDMGVTDRAYIGGKE